MSRSRPPLAVLARRLRVIRGRRAVRGGPRSELCLYGRLLSDARPYWPHIAGVFVLTMLATPIALLTPLPLKLVVDNVLGDEPLSPFLEGLLPAAATSSSEALLFFSAVLMVGVAVGRYAQELLLQLMRTYTGEKLVLRLRTQLFRHVQRLSLTYHDTKGTSDSSYRIQYDASAVQQVVVDGVIPLVGSAIVFGSMLYVTFLISWQLCLIALLASPFLVFLTVSYRPRLRAQSHVVREKETSALSVLQEVLTSIRVVKAFGQEEREADRFTHHSDDSLRARIRLVMIEGGFGLLIGITIAAGSAATLFVGANLVLSGSLSLGELILVLGYITQMYDPLKTVARKIGGTQRALASAERAFDLLDEAPDVKERQDAIPLVRARGELAFERVTFSYPGSQEPVLRDVSFSLEPGTRLGIAGTTGAGKTTLVSLVTRFFDPSAGAISLDGRDLRDYRLADLRNQFGIVLQEPVLFSTSIRENIAYARPEASPDEVIQAARLANIHEFVATLSDGYETPVGERGMRLSGGERQRVSIARAFLKDAPLLILDEPTSSVDVRTEAGIMESMERLMEGRTTVMIAHRVSTLEHCDLVLSLEHGEVVSLSKIDRPLELSSARGHVGMPAHA